MTSSAVCYFWISAADRYGGIKPWLPNVKTVADYCVLHDHSETWGTVQDLGGTIPNEGDSAIKLEFND